MDRIDLYIDKVGEHLPAKGRADLQAEIRSLIEDTLEGRSQAAGRPVDEAMVLDVLKEFGPPADVAAAYLPPRYLIGPRLFPTFLLVVRIVATVLVVIALFRFGVEVSAPGLTAQQMAEIAVQSLTGFFTGVLAALGNIVFIFAMLEWLLPKSALAKEDWDPRSLQPRADSDRLNPYLLILGTVFLVGLILLFNVYPQWVGVGYLQDGEWRVVPMLSEAFFRFVPLLTVVWALQIGLNVMLLRQMSWNRSARWFQVGIKTLELVILGMMIAGPSIINLQLGAASIPLENAERLAELASQGFRMVLVLVLLLSGWELVKMIVQLVSRNRQPLGLH